MNLEIGLEVSLKEVEELIEELLLIDTNPLPRSGAVNRCRY